MGRLGAAGRLRPRQPLGRARELQWDAYLLRSASIYEEDCGHHTITQGGYYQYDTGDNLGYRSWLHYLLPMAYAEPALAREILRYSIVQQPPPPNGRAAEPVRHRAAVHALRPRQLQRPRLLAAARGRRVRAGHARHVVLRRAAALLRHGPDGERVGAHQGGLRPPGDPARTARRLRDGHDRRLERLLDRARAADRVDARHRPARLRLPEARRAGRPARRPRRSPRSCAPPPQRGDASRPVDRARAGTRAATRAPRRSARA